MINNGRRIMRVVVLMTVMLFVMTVAVMVVT